MVVLLLVAAAVRPVLCETFRRNLEGEGYNAGMKRVGRYILNALTALSLVLCMATAGLWVRGQYAADSVVRDGPRSLFLISASPSCLQIYVERMYDRGDGSTPQWTWNG